MKNGTQAALALALALSLAACGGPAPVEETPAPTPAPVETAERLDFVLPCSPGAGFHPITGSNRTNLTLAPLLYRGLFSLDRDFQARKDLCESYTVSEDGLTWTFRLADAAFSDDTPLTGREAAASLELARQSPRYASRLAAVTRVTAGEGEVTLTLSRPTGGLPALLDVPIVKESGDPARPLGTGPYALAGTERDLKLMARPGAEVPLTEIPLRSIGATDDLVFAFDAREISLVDTDLTGTDALGYSGRLETTDYPTSTMLYLGFNLQSGPCQELAVRQAISRAMDRRSMAGKLLAGHAAASPLPVHPAAEGWSQTHAAALAYDLDAARVLLEEAGWTRAEGEPLRRGRAGLSLRLAVNQENTYKVTLAEAIAASLERLGCAVTVEKLPWDSFVTALERKNFDLYLGEVTLTADFDLGGLLGPGGALNYGGYANEETAALLDAWRAAEGPDRAEAGPALWDKLALDAPLAPLCFKNGSLLTQWGQVDGASPVQRNVFAGWERWEIRQF